MKLATYKDGSRDGQLVVVSRDLSTAHYATGIAQKLQQALDDWNFIGPQLQDLYVTLNQGKARHAFPFDPRMCMAPVPRAYERLSSVAFASLAEMLWPQRQATPVVFQARSDALLGACDDVVLPSEDDAIDFGAGLAVITGDVPQGATPDVALEGVRLLMLVNDWNLRAHAGGVCPDLQGMPAAGFSPVAVTPDELGDAWSGGRVGLALHTTWNGRKVGMCDMGEMSLHFGQLLAQACKTRAVRAGCIVGSGPVSNRGVGKGVGQDWPKGYACIAEKRAMEAAQGVSPPTDYMTFGDTVRIEVKGRDGQSIFGAIEQVVAPVE